MEDEFLQDARHRDARPEDLNCRQALVTARAETPSVTVSVVLKTSIADRHW